METHPFDRLDPSRRDLLKGAVAASAAAGLGGCRVVPNLEPPPGDAPAIAMPSRVVLENARHGTREWLPTNTRVDPKTKYRCPWVEGYCSHTSVRGGKTIRFFVSTNPASRFHLDVFRMGYYQGNGARLMTTLGPFDGVVQPEPAIGPNRVRECSWEAAAELVIPADWPSGVYVGKLTEHRENLQSYVIFIVRDDRRADFAFQCSDTTWQAYNRWPDQFSLYDDGKEQWYWGPGVDVSFDRPYGKYCQILDQPLSIGTGDFFCWEYPLVFWLEQNGYDVTYVSNLDTHADAAGLLRAKGFLSVGHDEYYSIEMFDHLKAAIARGVSVAFLSGNTCCGRIDPRARGAANRVFGRIDHFGPADNAERKLFKAMDRLPHTSPNEASLVGARSTGQITGGADYVCSMPEHWLFAGTGMKLGEAIPGLVGWEWHGDPATDIPGLEVVSTGPTRNEKTGKVHGTYASTIYPGPRGNVVFNASSCWWADGLSEPPGYMRPSVYVTPRGPDARVQRITRNLLERMRGA
jgi:hypothetical protein